MPGDDWQKFANLRLLSGYMYTQPGKKLLFMGDEFGQWREWNHDQSLDWHLLGYPRHAEIQKFGVQDLNRLYRGEAALYELDCNQAGFEWIDCNDSDGSVISFVRERQASRRCHARCLQLYPMPRFNYRVGAPFGGFWKELLNSDAKDSGGSGHGNLGRVEAAPIRS